MKKRRETNFSYNLAHNIRVRIHQAFKSQKVKKLNKTFDLLGCTFSFFQRWKIYQPYGEMTINIYGSVWEIDHCYSLSQSNLSNETGKFKSTAWINLRPMY